MTCTSTSPQRATRAAHRHRVTGARTAPRRTPTTLLTAVVAGLVLAGCFSTPAATPSPSARVTTAWTTFFKGSTPAATRLALLQDSSAFAAVLHTQTSSSFAKGLSVTVSKVAITSATTATVTYSILIGGSPELPGAKGEAVRIGGQWKVSTQSFCGLLQLEGGAPPICSAH
jgi:hypothetical protein